MLSLVDGPFAPVTAALPCAGVDRQLTGAAPPPRAVLFSGPDASAKRALLASLCSELDVACVDLILLPGLAVPPSAWHAACGTGDSLLTEGRRGRAADLVARLRGVLALARASAPCVVVADRLDLAFAEPDDEADAAEDDPVGARAARARSTRRHAWGGTY